MKINNILSAEKLKFVALIVLVGYILNLANSSENLKKRQQKYTESEFYVENEFISEKDLKETESFVKLAKYTPDKNLTSKIENLKSVMFKGVKISQENRKFIEGLIKVSLEEQEKFGIPASIKIAQAIIESGWGRDGLAKKHNNYFGIKHKRYYTEIEKKLVGMPIMILTHEYNKSKQKYYQRDNFISYETRWCSIRHHSIFLKDKIEKSKNPACKRMRNLSVHNYKAWAKNLQQAGYATNPNYARTLISLIEKYNLHLVSKLATN